MNGELCELDVSKGEVKKRRRILSMNNGCEHILNCLLGERRNYLCRQCAAKLKNYKEKKEELLSTK